MPEKADKRVEMTELFYDLVFVYAVSRTTELIHELHTGPFEIFTLFTFTVTFVILINTWMYQTVFINRYGTNGAAENILVFIQMGLTLVLANSIRTNWQTSFTPFIISAGLLSLILALQYVLIYVGAKSENDRRVSKIFAKILGVRTAVIFSSLLFSHGAGAFVALGAVISGLILPSFFVKKMKQRPVHFPHLAERMSLLVIIMFGEMFVGVSVYFNPEVLSPISAFVLITVVMMFLLYVLRFDHSINKNAEDVTGVAMIYLHYPIFFGIILVNVAFIYLTEAHPQTFVTVNFLYAGILMFIFGTLMGGVHYGKPGLENGRHASVWLPAASAGYALSIIFNSNPPVVIICTACVMSFISIFTYLELKNKSF